MRRGARWFGAMALLCASVVWGDDAPRWSVELKGGNFSPKTENWRQSFSRDSVTYYEFGVGYKPARQIEVALSTGYLRATGNGFAPLHGTAAGSVTYELFPLHGALLWRAIFDEDQWLVPYGGGGVSRFSYRQRIDRQAEVTGSANGTHARAGIQILLDRIDIRSANNFQQSTGVDNSYLFFEYQKTDVKKAGVQLGGTAILGGVMIEF